MSKRFKVFQNRTRKWIVEDLVKDKYLINIPNFIGFDDEKSANIFCEELNELQNEKENWKSHCSHMVNENSILWNEISIMREQGAEPSVSFKEYMKDIEKKLMRK